MMLQYTCSFADTFWGEMNVSISLTYYNRVICEIVSVRLSIDVQDLTDQLWEMLFTKETLVARTLAS